MKRRIDLMKQEFHLILGIDDFTCRDRALSDSPPGAATHQIHAPYLIRMIHQANSKVMPVCGVCYPILSGDSAQATGVVSLRDGDALASAEKSVAPSSAVRDCSILVS